ncbi:MAG: hypothetical protein LBB12_04700, partial [Holosporaceae bacterium]|nr:hypothetical protein [Holosporaceae bacterium]
MKSCCRKIIKLLAGLLAAIILAWIVVTTALFYDGSRQWALNLVVQYLKTHDINLSIAGLNRNLTYVKEVVFRSSDGIELIFRNVSMTRSEFFDRSCVHVGEFILNGSREEIDINQKLKELIPLMGTIRIFISKLTLGQGILNIMGKRFTLDGLTYKSRSDGDRLYSKIDNYHVLDILFIWNGLDTCVRSVINFDNFADMGGTLFIKNPENTEATCEFIAKNKKNNFELEARGRYRDFMLDITVTDAIVRNEKFACELTGNMYLKKKKADVKITLPMRMMLAQVSSASESRNGLLEQISDGVIVNCDLKYDFARQEENAEACVIFQKDGKKVGDLVSSLRKNTLDISGNIGWINIFGYAFKNFTCKVQDSKKISAKINGEGFDALANVSIGDRVSVDNFKLTSSGNGVVESSRPFVFGNNGECSLGFNFTRLEFFDKITSIGGNASGSLVYSPSKGIISAKCRSEKLHFDHKKNKFYELSVQNNGDDVKIEAKYAKLLNMDVV